MKITTKVLSLVAGILLAATFARSDTIRLRWVVDSQQVVDKGSAELEYSQVCRWLHDRLDEEDAAICPAITVHVGATCPIPGVTGSCMNPKLGELYLEKWDEDSLASLAEVVVATALVQYMEPRQNVRLA